MSSEDKTFPGHATGRQLSGRGLNFEELIRTGNTEFEVNADINDLMIEEEKDVTCFDSEDDDDDETVLPMPVPTKLFPALCKLQKNVRLIPSDNNYYYDDISSDEDFPETSATGNASPTSAFEALKPNNENAGGENKIMFFEDIGKEMTDITSDGGIKKMILQEGSDELVKNGQTVVIEYLISCEETGNDGIKRQKIIDSTEKRKSGQLGFRIGNGNVISVLDIGVQTMKPGEIARFLATPKYAYGPLGMPDVVGPDTEVMVEIAVINTIEGSKDLLLGHCNLTQEELEMVPFQEKFNAILELKQLGNDCFRNGHFHTATKKYLRALKIIRGTFTPIKEEVNNVREAECVLNTNLGACQMQLNAYRRAQRFLEEAINLQEVPLDRKVKAYFRLAMCLSEMGDFHDARKNIAIARNISPENPEIQALHAKLHQKLRDGGQDKDLARRMLGLRHEDRKENSDMDFIRRKLLGLQVNEKD